jgi:hypothetical protein
MNIGDEYINMSGDVVTIIGRGWGSIKYQVKAHTQVISEDDAIALVTSKAWVPYMGVPTDRMPGKCRKCGDINEYQRGSFTCYRCRSGF